MRGPTSQGLGSGSSSSDATSWSRQVATLSKSYYIFHYTQFHRGPSVSEWPSF